MFIPLSTAQYGRSEQTHENAITGQLFVCGVDLPSAICSTFDLEQMFRVSVCFLFQPYFSLPTPTNDQIMINDVTSLVQVFCSKHCLYYYTQCLALPMIKQYMHWWATALCLKLKQI